MTWPDDPYRASQQLYKRPPAMLAGLAVLMPSQRDASAPAALAIAYLQRHRTRPADVTEDTLTFGFRAASTADNEHLPELAGIADLDLMQARRHASVLAGHALAYDLRALREAAPGQPSRGLAATEIAWASRQTRTRGTAALIDLSDHGPGLQAACRSATVETSEPGGTWQGPGADERLAAAAAEQALATVLACARILDTHQWQGSLSTARIMAAAAWDIFPQVTWDRAPQGQPVPFIPGPAESNDPRMRDTPDLPVPIRPQPGITSSRADGRECRP